MNTESRDQLLARRLEQIRQGASEAIRREVEWLKRHNFPVWIWKNGRVVDATKSGDAEKSRE